jgi:hypothetical protein
MAAFTNSDDFKDATFTRCDLSGARFVASDLSGVVMRGVDIQGADIDAPWLFDGDDFLRVNGVDVRPFVDAELNRRFPGRALQRADDPDGLREAWAALERTWAATLERAAGMPAGTVDISVAGEWSFVQTLRHLILATDMWLGKAVLDHQQPFHPLGLIDHGSESEVDTSTFASEAPAYEDVLEARASRVALVRDFLAAVTPEELASTRKNPHAPAFEETVRSCLHTILEEEWEHHRYAVRDLDAIAADRQTR